jgi:benzylsuccinate CoA-transferase BbsF subunit
MIFKGLKVVEFTLFGIGPVAGRFLADYGATVVRVESENRPDPVRTSAPYADGKPGLNRSGFWVQANAGKYSVSLNLKHPLANNLAKRLVKWADIVIENFTPGVLESFGLDYEAMKEINPTIVLVRLSNLGQTGPHSRQRGTGGQLQAVSGFVELMGWPDRGPANPFGAICDNYPPRLGAIAIIAALLYKRRTGKGQYIDLSQLECNLPFLSPVILDYVINGRLQTRAGNSSPCAAPHGVYKCKGEDRWCAIAIFTEEQWNGFCLAMKNPSWTNEERFSTLGKRRKNEAELAELIEEWTCSRTPEEIMHLLQSHGVPAGIVANMQDLYRDPQLLYREHFLKVEHPEIGQHSMCNNGFRLSRVSTDVKSAPCLGEHNEFIWKEQINLNEEEYIKYILDRVLE